MAGSKRKHVTIAVVGDLHCGSHLALCPERVPLDNGGTYEATKAQRWLWQCWEDYWRAVKAARNGPLYVVLDGDLTDGDHHNTPEIISRNPIAQGDALTAALRIPLALKPDRVFVVRGTEAHAGRGASTEEGVAKAIREGGATVVAEPDTQTASWWHLRMSVEGVRLDIAHHGRTGHREHTRANAANLYAHDILLAHVKTGDPPPHLCIRGHHHKWNDSYDAAGVTRVITHGAWQFATAYVHKVAPDSLADIGGVIVTVEDGAYDVRKVAFKPERGPSWTA